MKSRYFSIPGLLVDVSEIVSVDYQTSSEAHIDFKSAPRVYTDIATAKSVQEYAEEYERVMTAGWQVLS